MSSRFNLLGGSAGFFDVPEHQLARSPDGGDLLRGSTPAAGSCKATTELGLVVTARADLLLAAEATSRAALTAVASTVLTAVATAAAASLARATAVTTVATRAGCTSGSLGPHSALQRVGDDLSREVQVVTAG